MGCLARVYRIGKCTAKRIVLFTCLAIHEELGPLYVGMPQTTQEWETVVNGFDQRWNYPACLRAIDSNKHVCIVEPKLSGSMYYNYKNFSSVIMLAIVNANYEFMYGDTGTEGMTADNGVLKHCSLWQDFIDGIQQIPVPVSL